MRVSVQKTGFALGVLLGAFHLMWAVLVAAGWAQPLMDFVFRLHFIQPVFVVEPFGIARALGLVALTSAIGYVLGATLAIVWNLFHD